MIPPRGKRYRDMLEQEITVLIVDDEEEIRSGLRRVIQRRYPDLRFLESAANGAEGLERIRAFLPDIVIADINMPATSGLEMIRQAREEGYAGSFVLLSGYDDFRYAQSAIRYGVDDYLIKPVVVDDLLRLIEQLKAKIEARRRQREKKVQLSQSLNQANRIITEQNFISEFLRGELAGHFLHEAIQKIDPRFEHSEVCAVVFYFCQKEIPSQNPAAQAGLNVWCDCIRRALSDWPICMGYDGRSSAVALLCVTPQQDRRRMMQDIATRLYRTYRVRCFVALGDPVPTLQEVYQSYKNALLISTWHIYPQLGMVGDSALLAKKIAYTPVDAGAVVKSIRQGDPDAVRREFRAYTDLLLQGDPAPAPAYLLSMYHLLITEVRTRSENALNSYTGDAYQTMRQFDTFDEIYAWVESVLVNFSHEVSVCHVGMQDPIIEKAIEYIRAHICQKLTAEDVCRHIGLSKTYFSKYFKEKTNLNFRDYLLDLKVNYAQQMLTENQYTPSELAVLLGYEEYSSFSRAFKARTGFSPQDYQKETGGHF